MSIITAGQNNFASDWADSLNNTLEQRAFNVKDYGAIGDGVTEDHVAIQRAVDDAVAAGGGIVFFPSGTYLLGKLTDAQVPAIASSYTNPSIWVSSNVHLIGAGMSTTTLKRNPIYDQTTVFSFIKGAEADNVSVKDMTLWGNKGASFVDGTENEGIDIKRECTDWVIERVKFYNIQNEAIDFNGADPSVMTQPEVEAYDALDDYQVTVRDCKFEDIGGSGIHGCNWMIVENCHFENVSFLRYEGNLAGEPSAPGFGAIDTHGVKFIIKGCTFNNNPIGVNYYSEIAYTVQRDCLLKDSVFVDSDQNTNINSTIRMKIGGVTTPISTIENIRVIGDKPAASGDKIICSSFTATSVDAPTQVGYVLLDCIIKGFPITLNASSSGGTIRGNTIDLTGRTIASECITMNISETNDVVISDNTLIQAVGNSQSCIGYTGARTQTGCRVIGNRCIGGNHGVVCQNNWVVSGNICTGQVYSTVTSRGDWNMIIGNVGEKANTTSANDLDVNNITTLP